MSFQFENLPPEQLQLQVPVYILKGQTSVPRNGLLAIFNDKFNVQYYEVYNGHFKAMIHLGPGVNSLVLQHVDGIWMNGQPAFPKDAPSVYAESKVKINYSPIQDDRLVPKIHLCVLVARDSPHLFDCPQAKMFEGNGLDVAIKKLRMGGRIMQAFTQDDMYLEHFGSRSFRFIEEHTRTTISYFEEQRGVKRDEIKIHVIPCNRTVAEIRNADYAQQNSKAKKAGELFSIAMDSLVKYGGPFSDQSTNSIPAMAAVMILDAHWDKSQNLILGHAALGGGSDRIKLAIFGSHGLHSWPMNLESLHRAFTDTTPISTNEVANDCNQCGTAWECFTLTLGAFMHEIGHLLGCPHQRNGVMLRDYLTMNRKFLPKEAYCQRTNRSEWGPVPTSQEPGWHRLDKIRFLYHPAFAVPSDFYVDSFKPRAFQVNQGMKLPQDMISEISVVTIDKDTFDLVAPSGLYLVEFITGEFPDLHYEFLPVFLQGQGCQGGVRISISSVEAQLKTKKPINLRILARGFIQKDISDIRKLLAELSTPVMVQGGSLALTKSEPYGGSNGRDVMVSFPDKNIKGFQVTHGLALDGIRVCFEDNSYVDFGNFKHHHTDFWLQKDEVVTGFNVRCGAWVDGIQILTNRKTSPMLGGGGGGVRQFLIPQGRKLQGLYGKMESWCISVGFLYG
ncbi:hypothetical protein OGAPHI_002729 [Ogataea philodendri]|uniref:Jacalin-type lectin domain-containing protein n=1 Tax=Ogataea philodendri TaxID=1378263 RepID=A0A9P8T7Z3_9ASCO|nr:uncharacterized protein OGAPHI_002729 [Ogataea philodendri]KAH3668974.1 hypothetical protein OGAPHI_002729 [Ogataea philodendri]